ncbi:hypothetical protein LZ554_004917 [Drepanopeziza brunnea f. sp. 'monogermtubi']|nr:hypothetical protein LZ554_004917 [Drepanopeziza brunnea f. sp. 'monogermtubi']
MRSSIIALLASAAIVFATGCARENLDEAVARIECADSSVTKCLRSADIRKLDEIEACLVAGGCSLGGGPSEAVLFTNVRRAGQEDLKMKRADISSDSTAELTATAVSAAGAEAITTSDPASSSQSTSSSTASSTSFSSMSISSVSASATGACSVTKTYSVSACSVSNGKTLTCIPTTSLSVSCAPGKICFTSTPNVCLTRKDSLDTAGLIVTVVFSIVLSAITIAVIVMVIRDYQREKQYRAAKLLAEAASKSQGEEARTSRKPRTTMKPMASHADLPLMTPAEDRNDNHSVHQE